MCEEEENTIANLARATKVSELWDPTTFMDKYDVTGRPVPFHWPIFSGHTTIQLKREIQTILGSTEPWYFRGRSIFMSMFNNTEDKKLGNEQTCPEHAKEVTDMQTNSS